MAQDSDGSLLFRFPLVIYHKAVRVLLVATNEVSWSVGAVLPMATWP